MTSKNLLSAMLCAITISISGPCLYAQKVFDKQRVIVIMMDGFGEKYYRAASMPFLNQMEQRLQINL